MPFTRYFKYIVPLQITVALLNLVVLLMLFIAIRIDSSQIPPPDPKGLSNNNNNSTIPNSNSNNNNNSTMSNSNNNQTASADDRSTGSEEGTFLAYEQLTINILVIVGCVVSLLAPYRLKSNYRFSMVWVISIAGLVVGISQFIMIGLRGGCNVPYYSEQVSRCSIQLGVSTVDVLWVLLLLVEGALSYQRSIDKDFQRRLREQEEEGSERWRWSVTSVVYNPDLAQQESLQRQQLEEEQEAERAAAAGRENEEEDEEEEESDVEGDLEEGGIAAGGEGSSGRRRRARRTLVVQTPIEMEPLPKYKPKPARGQPRIIDLGNMPLPPAPSTPPPPVSPIETSSERALPSSSTTITISTGTGVIAGTGTGTGMDSGVTAEGTTGTGTDTGALASSLPPSYSA
ncbi:MAG: hypothetical protein J3R72DRAFT_449745 [Linnemannia gamsii]|nr:MAG: hypothetical protein J3R72DRAFT_449745 [Linnemannia gamsii]